MSQSHQRAPSQQTEQGTPSAGSAALATRSNSAPAKKQGGVMGWLQGAGRWMADKTQAAAEAVGGFVDRTKKAATDVWEVVKETDLDIKDGKIVAETDLDEVLDILPASVRAMFELDRGKAANRARMSVDPRTGVIIIESDEIAIGRVQTASLQTGAAFLRGVRVEVARPGGGLGKQESQPKDGQDQAKVAESAAKVSCASAEVVDVVWQGGGSPVRVARLQLAGLAAALGERGGALGLGGADGKASVVLEKAVMEGLVAGGHSVGKVEADGVEAGLSAGGERAFVQAGKLSMSDAQSGGQRLGNATVNNARVDLENQGGGLPFADQKADHLRARVGVEAASVTDFDGDGQDISSLQAKKLQADLDLEQGAGRVRSEDLVAKGVDTAWVDAGVVDADALDVGFGKKDGRNQLDLGAQRLAGEGVVVGAPALPQRPKEESAPLDWKTRIGEVDIDGMDAAGVHLGRTRAGGLEASGTADGSNSSYAMRSDSLAAEKVSHELGKAERIAGYDVALQGGSAGAGLTAGSLSAKGVDGAMLSARSVDASGAKAQFGGGNAEVSLDKGQMDDARFMGRTSAEQLKVGGFRASARGKDRRLQAESVEAKSIRDAVSGISAGNNRLSGVNVHQNGDDLEASLAAIQSTELAGMGAKVGSLDGKDLAVQRKGANWSGGAGELSAARLSRGQDRADALSVQGLRGSAGPTEQKVGIAGAQGSGISVGGISASEARLGKSSAERKGDALGVTVDEASAKGVAGNGLAAKSLAVSGVSGHSKGNLADLQVAQASGTGLAGAGATVGSADLKGISARKEGDRLSGSLTTAELDALAWQGKGQGASATSLDLQGLSATKAGGQLDVGLAGAQAKGVQANSGGNRASVASVGIGNAKLSDGARGTQASVGSLDVSGAKAHLANSAGGAGGTSGVDNKRLISSLAQRVDDAQVSATVPLIPGKIDGMPAKIEKGTVLSTDIQVADNRLVPGGTGANLNKPVDGPLWTTVRGAYMTDDGEMKADVGGFKDLDVGGKINDSLGLEGDKLRSVGEMGAAYARMPASPGGGGAMPVDLANYQAKGKVGLSAGKIDAGKAGSVNLAPGQRPGDNAVSFEAGGKTGIDAAFQRLLASGFSSNVGGVSAQGGRTRLEDGSMHQGKSGTDAEIGRIQAEGLSVNRPR